MSLSDLLSLMQELGLRAYLKRLLPASVLVVFVAALIESGAPDNAPDLDKVIDRVQGLKAHDVLLLLGALVVLSAVVQPVQRLFVRSLQGSPFGMSFLNLYLATLLTPVQRRRRERIAKHWSLQGSFTVRREKRPAGKPSQGPRQRRSDSFSLLRLTFTWPRPRRKEWPTWWRSRFYDPEGTLAPTALGNAFLASQRRAGRKYGLNDGVIWPRLLLVVPDRLGQQIAARQEAVDLAAGFWASSVLASVFSLWLLAGHGWWLLTPLITLSLARSSHRRAIESAVSLGDVMEMAFDFHRFDLLQALHFPLPPDHESEQESNESLCRFLRGETVSPTYQHVAVGRGHDDRDVETSDLSTDDS